MKKKLATAIFLTAIALNTTFSQASAGTGIGEFSFYLSSGQKDVSDSVVKAVDWQYLQVSGCTYNGNLVDSQLMFRGLKEGGTLMTDFARYTGQEPLNINYTKNAAAQAYYRIRGYVKEGSTGGSIAINGKWRP